MRKQTKLVAVLSAAALMAIGMSATAFAAAPHWDQEDGEWVYLDRNGDKVTDEWKKSNGQWYYLDSDGYMAKDQVIEDDDDKYYVDENGARVTNAWVSMDNDDLLDDEDAMEDIDTVWMYFDSNGKALGCDTTNGEIKKLSYGDGQSGYFIFNEDGYMLSGWQKWDKNGSNKSLYYLGNQNEGWAHTGWQKLEIDPDIDAFSGIDEDDYDEDEYWFYFKSSGKAVKNDTRNVGGKTYIFDEYGIMLDLWVYKDASSNNAYTNLNTASSSAAGAAYYAEDNGGRDKNWIYAYPKSNYDDYDDDPYWFYLDSNGKPFIADADSSKVYATGAAVRVDDDDVTNASDPEYNGVVAAKSIKSETYLFNDKGVMLSGLYWLGSNVEGEDDAPVYKGTSETALAPGYYYFTTAEGSTEGQLQTNKRVKIEIEDEDEEKTFYFNKQGKAYTNCVINGYVYGWDGRMVDSYGDGSTYERVSLNSITHGADLTDKSGKTLVKYSDDIYVLVNENGKIRKSGTTNKDVNDQKVVVNDYIAGEPTDND